MRVAVHGSSLRGFCKSQGNFGNIVYEKFQKGKSLQKRQKGKKKHKKRRTLITINQNQTDTKFSFYLNKKSSIRHVLLLSLDGKSVNDAIGKEGQYRMRRNSFWLLDIGMTANSSDTCFVQSRTTKMKTLCTLFLNRSLSRKNYCRYLII